MMRTIGTLVGILFIATGVLSLFGGDITDAFSPWMFAVLVAAIGIGGLVRALDSNRS